MTQEEKTLLLKDLCARLPYGVILSVTLKDKYDDIVNRNIELTEHNIGYITKASNWQEYKPYLRPMSNMTEEEIEELNNLVDKELKNSEPYFVYEQLTVDFYLRHHLDNRLMIEKGLALEAPEGMYDLKEK